MEKNKSVMECKKEMYDITCDFDRKIKEALKGNIIETVEFRTDGGNVIFNQEHFKIKMAFHENDYEDIPYTVLALGDFEKDEMVLVKRLLSYLPDDAVCFDIGANMGWYTLHILKSHPNMKVFSFEPSPITYERLRHNMSLNGFSTQNCINAGLFKEEGKLEFYYDPNGSGASSLVNLREKDTVHKILVDMTTMDLWMKNTNHGVDFIKCDVEGSELFVYQGGRETITKYKPIIFSEMLRKWSAKFGYHPNDIIQLLKSIGYQCYIIAKSGSLKEITEVTEETVETNYFFLHYEKHEEIIRNLTSGGR